MQMRAPMVNILFAQCVACACPWNRAPSSAESSYEIRGYGPSAAVRKRRHRSSFGILNAPTNHYRPVIKLYAKTGVGGSLLHAAGGTAYNWCVMTTERARARKRSTKRVEIKSDNAVLKAVDDVANGGGPRILERDGKAFAAVLGPDDFSEAISAGPSREDVKAAFSVFGAWADRDTEAMKRRIHSRRRSGSRPASRPPL